MESDLELNNKYKSKHEDLIEVSRKYGTPLYVINKNILLRSSSELKNIFKHENIDVEIFFSYKTNPVPEVLKTFAEIQIGAEVISEFELWLAEKIGIKGNKIIVNGANKTRNFLLNAINFSVSMINIESINELLIIKKIANELKKKVNIGLRINPSLKNYLNNFTIVTGSVKSCFGLAPNSFELDKILEILKEDPYLNFQGIHFHIGTGIKHAQPYINALSNILKLCEKLIKKGFKINVLDIGGGFNIPSLKEITLWDAIKLYLWNKSSNPTIDGKNNLLSHVATTYFEMIIDFCKINSIPPFKIYLEPGRALSSAAQVLILKVGRVTKKGKKNYAFCDGGALSLSNLLITESHNIEVINKPIDTNKLKYNLMGNLPSPLDIVCLERELPILQSGDLISVMDAGAYFSSLGNNFAGPRPAIVMFDGNSYKCIRKREAFEDLISRDSCFNSFIQNENSNYKYVDQ